MNQSKKVKKKDPLQQMSPPNTEPTDFPLTKALQLRFEKQLSFENIAKIIGFPKTTTVDNINNAIKLLNAGDIKQSSDLYDNIGIRMKKARAWELLVMAGDQEKAKKATLGNVYYGLTQVENSIRLDQNQPTQNIQVLVEDIQKIRPRFEYLQKLLEERLALEDNSDVVDVEAEANE